MFNPPPPPPRGDVYSWATSAGWQATVSCSNAWSPQGARKVGHIPEDSPLPFPFAHVVSFGSSPVILSIPPTAQPFTCARLSPGGSRSLALSCALCPSACHFHQITFPVSLCVSVNLRPLRTGSGPVPPTLLKGKIFPFSALSAWCTSFVALNTFTLSDHNAGFVSCSPVSAHRSPHQWRLGRQHSGAAE